MRTRVTLPLILRIVGTVQVLFLYAWGLARWPLGTLLISTAYIALWLALNDRDPEPKPSMGERPLGRPAPR